MRPRPVAFGLLWFVLMSQASGQMSSRLPQAPADNQRRSPLSDIVGIILHTHFQTPYTTTLVVLRSQTEDGRDGLRDLLSVLLIDYVRGQLVVQFDGAPQRPGYHRPWTHILLLVEGYESLRTVYGQLTLARYDFAGFYLVVLTGVDITLATVDRIFNDLWTRQIVNVIVVFHALQQRVVQLWTYYPYSPGLCRVPKPYLLLTWPNDTLLYGVNFFPRKNVQFHGCPLKVGTFETRPFTIITTSPIAGSTTVLTGFEGDLLRSLSAKLNFDVKLHIPPRSQQWGVAAFENSTGMMRMIYTEEVDLGISCLGVSFERSAMLKPGKVHITTELVVAVPPGRAYTPLEKLFQPFRSVLWYAILAYTGLGLLTIVAIVHWPGQGGPVVRRYLIGRRVQGPALNLFRLLFANPLPRTPAATFPRTLLLLWIQLCLVLQILYQGSMFKFLQRSSRYPAMTTLAEIDRAGVRYHIADSARRFFEPFPNRLAHVQPFPPGPDSIATRLRWMGEHPDDPDVTMCTRDHVAHHNLMHRSRDTTSERLLIAREPMALYSATILYPKKSMLTTSFDDHIERIESSGLLKYWVSRYGDYHFFDPRSRGPAGQSELKPISVEQLLGAFELLLCLLSVSGVVLLGELYWVRQAAHLTSVRSLAILKG